MTKVAGDQSKHLTYDESKAISLIALTMCEEVMVFVENIAVFLTIFLKFQGRFDESISLIENVLHHSEVTKSDNKV